MNETFSIRDLYVAGFLYASGAKFLRVDRIGKTCWFVFENKNLCEGLQQEFFAKTGQVIGKEYADAIRTLKDLVFTNS